MTILQVKCFLSAAKYQSYSRAAESLYISQPTFSRQIQSLEEELNAELFVRSNNQMLLTAIGQEILPEMEETFQKFSDAQKKMKDKTTNFSGRLCIGILSGNPVDHAIGEAARFVSRHHPNANILVCHQYQNSAFDEVMSGAVDVLVAQNHTMTESSQLDYVTIYNDYLCLAVPANHRNANLPSIAHEEVDKYFAELKLYVLDASEFDAEVSSQRVPANNLDVRIKFLSGAHASMDTLMMMVDAGLSMALLPSRYMVRSNQRVKMIPISLPKEIRKDELRPDLIETRVYWKRQNTNPLLGEFLEYLKTLL